MNSGLSRFGCVPVLPLPTPLFTDTSPRNSKSTAWQCRAAPDHRLFAISTFFMLPCFPSSQTELHFSTLPFHGGRSGHHTEWLKNHLDGSRSLTKFVPLKVLIHFISVHHTALRSLFLKNSDQGLATGVAAEVAAGVAVPATGPVGTTGAVDRAATSAAGRVPDTGGIHKL